MSITFILDDNSVFALLSVDKLKASSFLYVRQYFIASLEKVGMLSTCLIVMPFQVSPILSLIRFSLVDGIIK